jgi:REP element-mobilizing transposase RayT
MGMARKPRIEFEGALYHVITRGNQRQPIFKAIGDYQRYLAILEDYKSKYDFLLYAYVLMKNHVHLLMETKQVPLSKILQGINQRYTMYFNRRYGTVGHIFQGRYKAMLCEKDSYLLSLVKYIHLNPVRAEIAKTPETYPWSSHRFYIGQSRGEGIVDSESILKMFGDDRRKALRAYRDYMEAKETLRREDVYAAVDQRIVGDEEFVEEVKTRTGRSDLHGRRKYLYSLPEIAKAVEELSGVSLEYLRGKGRGETLGRGRGLISLAAKEYGYKGREVAEYLFKDPSVITRYAEEGNRWRDEIEMVHAKLLENRAKNKKQA